MTGTHQCLLSHKPTLPFHLHDHVRDPGFIPGLVQHHVGGQCHLEPNPRVGQNTPVSLWRPAVPRAKPEHCSVRPKQLAASLLGGLAEPSSWPPQEEA